MNNIKYRTPVIKILKGKMPGKTSIIMAGTHGNEVCGVYAFNKILPNLSIESGKVIFVIGNPKAVKMNIRFNELNLNRAFLPSHKYPKKIKNSYEYIRAQKLKKILDQGDALLDVHSTLNPSQPFIISNKNAININSYLPKEFKRIVYGFDLLHQGSTDDYMNLKGGIGICVECGEHTSLKAAKIAENAIFSFLNARNHINILKIRKVNNRETVQMESIYINKTNSFILSKNFLDFEQVKKGTLIGTDGKQKIKATTNGVIVFAHNREKKNEEAFLLGKVII